MQKPIKKHKERDWAALKNQNGNTLFFKVIVFLRQNLCLVILLYISTGYAVSCSISIIPVHNPEVLKASGDDRQLTHRLKSILKIVDVKLIDHVIVGRGGALSFVEKKLI